MYSGSHKDSLPLHPRQDIGSITSSSKSCGYSEMAFLTAVLLSFVLVTYVQCYPNGAPVSAVPTICSGNMMPHHPTTAQNTTAPYKITVPTCYKAGSSVKVTVEATSGYYKGLFMLARINGNSTAAFGTFTVDNAADFKLVDCYSQNGSGVTHSSSKEHTSEVFMWTPPNGFKHNIKFQATSIKNVRVFWVDIFSSEVSYSETCGDSANGAEATRLHASIFVVVSFIAAFLHLQ